MFDAEDMSPPLHGLSSAREGPRFIVVIVQCQGVTVHAYYQSSRRGVCLSTTRLTLPAQLQPRRVIGTVPTVVSPPTWKQNRTTRGRTKASMTRLGMRSKTRRLRQVETF